MLCNNKCRLVRAVFYALAQLQQALIVRTINNLYSCTYSKEIPRRSTLGLRLKVRYISIIVSQLGQGLHGPALVGQTKTRPPAPGLDPTAQRLLSKGEQKNHGNPMIAAKSIPTWFPAERPQKRGCSSYGWYFDVQAPWSWVNILTRVKEHSKRFNMRKKTPQPP